MNKSNKHNFHKLGEGICGQKIKAYELYATALVRQ